MTVQVAGESESRLMRVVFRDGEILKHRRWATFSEDNFLQESCIIYAFSVRGSNHSS